MRNDTKSNLIQCAIKCVSQFGPEGTTIKKVVKLAELSEGSVYRYFSSEEDLLENAFIAVDEKFCNFFLRNKENLVIKGDQKQSLKNLCDCYMTYLCENKDDTVFFYRYYTSTLYEKVESKRSLNNGNLLISMIKMEQLFGISSDKCQAIKDICALSILLAYLCLTGRSDSWVADKDSIFVAIYGGVMALHQSYIESNPSM